MLSGTTLSSHSGQLSNHTPVGRVEHTRWAPKGMRAAWPLARTSNPTGCASQFFLSSPVRPAIRMAVCSQPKALRAIRVQANQRGLVMVQVDGMIPAAGGITTAAP